jgi:hypothetical protein
MKVFGLMLRLNGLVAMFVAMAALLLHASCTIGATPLAAPTDSGCHESTPSPNPPNPEQKCCDGDHSPEALLSATIALAPPVANMELAYRPSITNVFERQMAEILSPSPGPPLLISLRI